MSSENKCSWFATHRTNLTHECLVPDHVGGGIMQPERRRTLWRRTGGVGRLAALHWYARRRTDVYWILREIGIKPFGAHFTSWTNNGSEYLQPVEMIRNGHHTTGDAGGEVVWSEPGGSVRSPEKRKRVVRLWCDGWWVSVRALPTYSSLSGSLNCFFTHVFSCNWPLVHTRGPTGGGSMLMLASCAHTLSRWQRDVKPFQRDVKPFHRNGVREYLKLRFSLNDISVVSFTFK